MHLYCYEASFYVYKCVKCYDCSETRAVGNIIVVQNLQTLLQTYMITEQLMIRWLI